MEHDWEGGKAFYDMIREHAMSMSERDRLAYLARFLWGSPYSWGNEIVGDVDCSGSICWSLYLMGYNIRITADGIFKSLCVPLKGKAAPGDLAFFIPEGESKVKHVVIFSDSSLVMDADVGEGFIDTPLNDEVKMRPGQRLETGRIDFIKAAEMSESGENAWGVDPGLERLFGIFAGE